MSMKEFNVRIKLGNAAMRKGSDVAAALRDLADWLDGRPLEPRDSFGIRDLNGHTVGVAQVDRVGIPRVTDSPYYDAAIEKLTGVEARGIVIRIGAMLGSVERWDNDSIMESIAGLIKEDSKLPRADTWEDEVTADFWCNIAEELGWETDREDEYDDDYDAEMDAREDQD